MARKQQKTTGKGKKTSSGKNNSTKKAKTQKAKQEVLELTPEEREQNKKH